MAPPTSTDAPASDKLRVLDRVLKDRRHPPLEDIVRAARSRPHPKGRGPRTSWPLVATRVFELTGEYVSAGSLRNWFGHLDPDITAGD